LEGQESLVLNGQDIEIKDVIEVAFRRKRVEPSFSLLNKLDEGYEKLKNIVSSGEKVYGLTTGFGSLAEKSVSSEDASYLQKSLLLSHAQGIGEPLPREVVRAMLLLRTQTLARNFSGVRGMLVTYLTTFLNNDYHPVVPSQGSVGASGDLIPLAHLALPLIGRGKVEHNNHIIDGKKALQELNLLPYSLELREGLALINGTQAMLSLLIYTLHHSYKLLNLYNLASSMSMEALCSSTSFLNDYVYKVRPHPGIGKAIAGIKNHLEGSQLVNPKPPHRVQEAYSLRCVPQVHGTTETALTYAENLAGVEVNSVTDNPLITPENLIVSQGNFHGAPLAWILDSLAIVLAPLGNMSERRVYKLLSGSYEKSLPSYLSLKPGIQSGLMILQYQSASLVNYNKILAHPASVDTIPTAQGQEDHVSMGMNAGLKLIKIIDNLYYLLVIELITASRALRLQGLNQAGKGAKWFEENYGSQIPHSFEDQSLTEEMECLKKELLERDFP